MEVEHSLTWNTHLPVTLMWKVSKPSIINLLLVGHVTAGPGGKPSDRLVLVPWQLHTASEVYLRRGPDSLFSVTLVPSLLFNNMKVFQLIFSLLCVVSCAFCASPSPDKFEKYQSLSRFGPLDLNDSLYEDITSKPHDYYVAILLTASEPRFGCILCREFQPEWELIARSWNKGSEGDSPRLLFGSLDFSNGRGTFQKV